MAVTEFRTRMASIVKASAAHAFGVPVMAINHGSNRPACDARRATTWFLCDVAGIPWDELAQLLGRDPSTLRHHYRKHGHFMQTDSSYAAKVEVMLAQLNDNKEKDEDKAHDV